MTEPYLILHKVRGEPAFDVAIRLVGNEGEDLGWIIPTSGHAAYPFWSITLSELDADYILINDGALTAMPTDWPDHYACNDRPVSQDVYEVKAKAVGLLEGLGLVKKVTVERRF